MNTTALIVGTGLMGVGYAMGMYGALVYIEKRVSPRWSGKTALVIGSLALAFWPIAVPVLWALESTPTKKD